MTWIYVWVAVTALIWWAMREKPAHQIQPPEKKKEPVMTINPSEAAPLDPEDPIDAEIFRRQCERMVEEFQQYLEGK